MSLLERSDVTLQRVHLLPTGRNSAELKANVMHTRNILKVFLVPAAKDSTYSFCLPLRAMENAVFQVKAIQVRLLPAKTHCMFIQGFEEMVGKQSASRRVGWKQERAICITQEVHQLSMDAHTEGAQRLSSLLT